MHKVTAVEPQKNRNRVNIHLDGKFKFGLDRIVAAWLKPGDELSDAKVEQLIDDDAREQALQQALLYLSFRARSEQEIRQNLRKHQIAEPVIDATLIRLRAQGLADDDQFARAWVDNRGTFRPRSRRALTVELRQKGLGDEAVRAAVADVDEAALVYDSARKRAGRFKTLEWPEFRRKLSEYLARRGFSYSVIAPAVRRVWNEAHPQAQHHKE